MDAIQDPRIREGLFRAQPTTLDEAIEAVLNVEAFVNMESGRRQEARYTGHSRALGEEHTVEPIEAVEGRLEKSSRGVDHSSRKSHPADVESCCIIVT